MAYQTPSFVPRIVTWVSAVPYLFSRLLFFCSTSFNGQRHLDLSRGASCIEEPAWSAALLSFSSLLDSIPGTSSHRPDCPIISLPSDLVFRHASHTLPEDHRAPRQRFPEVSHCLERSCHPTCSLAHELTNIPAAMCQHNIQIVFTSQPLNKQQLPGVRETYVVDHTTSPPGDVC